MNIYNITKGQLVVLWVIGLVVVFTLWMIPQPHSGIYVKPYGAAHITTFTDFVPVINVVILGLLVFYTLGWKRHNSSMPKVKRFAAARGYLDSHKEITNQDYRKLTGISEATATRDLDELEKSGVVEQVGRTGKYVKYRLKP